MSRFDSLQSRKGSRLGNSGNKLEFQVLTRIHHIPSKKSDLDGSADYLDGIKLDVKASKRFQDGARICQDQCFHYWRTQEQVEETSFASRVGGGDTKKIWEQKPRQENGGKGPNEHGAWGPRLKSKQHFLEMHLR
ncbi:unnamed protein product [Darwinula stevensoni]|uniref:Uncharacterized protein n=1 Tax=Darwinula stevensoni TaxID=69355 RepID=A0A7R8XCU3_9CRUS|nr:unnamed protein product [Darwinula stevensoni]CAG0892886.1 unnamed protein product [Darwinula stevensoni]